MVESLNLTVCVLWDIYALFSCRAFIRVFLVHGVQTTVTRRDSAAAWCSCAPQMHLHIIVYVAREVLIYIVCGVLY